MKNAVLNISMILSILSISISIYTLSGSIKRIDYIKNNIDNSHSQFIFHRESFTPVVTCYNTKTEKKIDCDTREEIAE